MTESIPSTPTAPADHAIQVRVYTRWHQLSTLLAFLLAPTVFALAVFNRVDLLAAAGAAVLVLVLPPLMAFRGFPTRNSVTVTPEALHFSRRSPVPYGELSTWGTDDYLKLVRPGRATLLVSAVDLPSRERLLREFRAALEAWEKRQPAGSAPVQRTHFYGTWRSRGIGLFIMAMAGGAIVVAFSMREPAWGAMVFAAMAWLFGLRMALDKRQ
ncbi:hypothetical protein GCM10007205_10040 [Oxalicibacterium flavum]|uniref:Uncharacterized protein n=1 Tax=Oxalicibacterium flavum TaxID=179467 RepID=A0A8J2UN61_9BURK|nr:hypothetical protein [Oxalicibacterium flavum]GGC02860.1 hypothetical protein GCM10007205_10040 [Oxalicibacterium flavum]